MELVGVSHFKNILKSPPQATLAEVIRVAQLFPRFVVEEDKNELMEVVSEEELKDALSILDKDKIPVPNGWTIEFFIGLFDLIGGDLIKVVDDTRSSRHISTSFNSTFIALIPKVDNPSSLNDFRPIYLCNCVYKVIMKIISYRLKEILSLHIIKEQFRFLEGR